MCDGVVNVYEGEGVGESDVVVDFDTATLVEIVVFVRDAAVPEFVIWELQCGTLPIGMKTADNGTAALLLMVPDKRSPNSPESSLQYCVIPCAAAAAAEIIGESHSGAPPTAIDVNGVGLLVSERLSTDVTIFPVRFSATRVVGNEKNCGLCQPLLFFVHFPHQ
jgi:hypothetical protein